jgi:hypothetical protein
MSWRVLHFGSVFMAAAMVLAVFASLHSEAAPPKPPQAMLTPDLRLAGGDGAMDALHSGVMLVGVLTVLYTYGRVWQNLRKSV